MKIVITFRNYIIVLLAPLWIKLFTRLHTDLNISQAHNATTLNKILSLESQNLRTSLPRLTSKGSYQHNEKNYLILKKNCVKKMQQGLKSVGSNNRIQVLCWNTDANTRFV